jgi:hypothetical protein
LGITNIVGTTSPISLDVYSNDNPPTCAFLNITDGQTLYGTVQIDATASDDVGIERVELYVDGVLLATDTSAPYSFTFDTRITWNGTHALSIIAYDQVLQTATASVSVAVQNIFAPENLTAQRVLNRGALLRENINVLTWKDSPRNATNSKFRVYLVNGGQRQLLGEVNRDKVLGPYTYLHRGVSGSLAYTYQVLAVGLQDREGDAASVTVR